MAFLKTKLCEQTGSVLNGHGGGQKIIKTLFLIVMFIISVCGIGMLAGFVAEMIGRTTIHKDENGKSTDSDGLKVFFRCLGAGVQLMMCQILCHYLYDISGVMDWFVFNKVSKGFLINSIKRAFKDMSNKDYNPLFEKIVVNNRGEIAFIDDYEYTDDLPANPEGRQADDRKQNLQDKDPIGENNKSVRVPPDDGRATVL